MSSTDGLAAEFTAHRPHLLGVGYRLTGSLADAEDAVQEAWLRLAGLTDAGRAGIADLRAWLTTVVGRICVDKLRSAAVRRERYVGSWLPEPLVTELSGDGKNPLDLVVRDDGVRMAALVVLDRLSPPQRVAFVLHDAFGVPFGEIAELLGSSVQAARQHATRARRAVADADPPARSVRAEQQEVLSRFLAAMATGDVRAVLELLHPDAVLLGDSDGKAKTAFQTISGADKVARFILGLQTRYGAESFTAMRFVLVNGELGMYFPAWAGDAEHPPFDRRVFGVTIHDGRLSALYDMVNPDKLTRVERP
ncbi:MAG TPA: sigma-70 family RNA polymerase sigma factor [Pseudonocardiaceae bacterium]|jgi:RNA polymerase sigma-70 factor (ECF subfamily)